MVLITQILNIIGPWLAKSGVSLVELAKKQHEKGGQLSRQDLEELSKRAQAAIDSIKP